MAKEVYVIIHSNVHPVSGETYASEARDQERFLRNVITPIYDVLYQEAKRNKRGRESNSIWRNYDDLNEYFWSEKCFSLGWPMNPNSDFFGHPDGIQTANELEKRKI
ncbi:1,3-beta-glucan synthase subunit [Trema orientale]|uniref:1,3-beta-glucan synthase subunit n=1 Tax=Trema orientale TaxID=63057 RepID=A0A2P5DIG2_TREOI|nr:1,3-beta-glucan synthase subunit [Trema orientale]